MLASLGDDAYAKTDSDQNQDDKNNDQDKTFHAGTP